MSVKFLQISLFPFIKVIFKIVYLDNYLTGKLPAQNSRITWARKENVFPTLWMKKHCVILLRYHVVTEKARCHSRCLDTLQPKHDVIHKSKRRVSQQNAKPHLKINNVKHCCSIPAKAFVSNGLYRIERLLFSWICWIISEFRRSSLRIARDASAAKSSSRKK